MTTTLEIPNGLLLVDKPTGVSSRAVVDRVIHSLGKVKAGHCGTLDPMASGLLIMGIAKGTRTMEHLLLQRKTYRAKVLLGVQTDTADLEGQVIQKQAFTVPDHHQLTELCQSLCGEMTQVAPKYSALKHEGKPFYKLAREGKSVPRRERRITLYRMQLGEISDTGFSFEVECSKGTYIRTLAEDIAQRIGTVGCLEALQRTTIGQFNLVQATPLTRIEELSPEQVIEHIVPLDQAFRDLPSITLKGDLSRAFCVGKALPLSEEITDQTTGKARVYNEDNTFLGITEIVDGSLKPSKVWCSS